MVKGEMPNARSRPIPNRLNILKGEEGKRIMHRFAVQCVGGIHPLLFISDEGNVGCPSASSSGVSGDVEGFPTDIHSLT